MSLRTRATSRQWPAKATDLSRPSGQVNMKPFYRNLLLALLPLVGGLAVSGTLRAWLHPLPEVMFTTDVGSVLATLGGIASAVLLAAALSWELAARRGARRIVEVQRAQGEARRRFVRRLDHELKNP